MNMEMFFTDFKRKPSSSLRFAKNMNQVTPKENLKKKQIVYPGLGGLTCNLKVKYQAEKGQ